MSPPIVRQFNDFFGTLPPSSQELINSENPHLRGPVEEPPFDSGNLHKVAQALHEKYPHKPIIIAGDDDRNQESVNGKNPGREKALEAAELVEGAAVLPTFAPNEQVIQKLSDFNDLANKSTLGVEAVKRQVGSVVARVSEQVKGEKLQHRAEKNQQVNKQRRTLML